MWKVFITGDHRYRIISSSYLIVNDSTSTEQNLHMYNDRYHFINLIQIHDESNNEIKMVKLCQ